MSLLHESRKGGLRFGSGAMVSLCVVLTAWGCSSNDDAWNDALGQDGGVGLTNGSTNASGASTTTTSNAASSNATASSSSSAPGNSGVSTGSASTSSGTASSDTTAVQPTVDTSVVDSSDAPTTDPMISTVDTTSAESTAISETSIDTSSDPAIDTMAETTAGTSGGDPTASTATEVTDTTDPANTSPGETTAPGDTTGTATATDIGVTDQPDAGVVTDPVEPIGETGVMVGITEAHNVVRAMVMAQPMLADLTWDDDLAAFAQQWADTLAATGDCAIEHRPRESHSYGENIATFGSSLGWPDTTAAAPVQAWADEVDCWTYSTISDQSVDPNCDMQCAADLNASGCGHYTQLVWANSERVGCGMARCTDGQQGYNWEIWVCNYDPAGNYIGQYPYSEL